VLDRMSLVALYSASRLLGGSLYAASPRVDWATLLRPSFEVDVLCWVGCGGRLRVLGEGTEPSLAALVFETLGPPPDAPASHELAIPPAAGAESD
jgi:hypothetical protein